MSPLRKPEDWGVKPDATRKVDMYRPEVDRVLGEIGVYMGWDGDISQVFVSDGTQIADFLLGESEVKHISKKLGLGDKLTPYDYVWVAAYYVRERGNKLLEN